MRRVSGYECQFKLYGNGKYANSKTVASRGQRGGGGQVPRAQQVRLHKTASPKLFMTNEHKSGYDRNCINLYSPKIRQQHKNTAVQA